MIHRVAVWGMAAVGATLVAAALVWPWMTVPVRLERDASGTPRCLTAEPGPTIVFRAGCLAFGVLLTAGHVRRASTSARKAGLAGAWMAALAGYPFAAMSLDGRLSAEAAWLNVQHENLVWLGGDLPTNLEGGRSSWKEHVYLVDTPRQISVVQMPSSQLGAFRFARLMHWLDTLGYSNRFCQFVGRGWIAALLGAFLLACAECMPRGRLDRGRALSALGATACAGMLVVTLAAVPVLLAARSLERARGAIASGLYDVGRERLSRAARYLPALAEDTFFVAQTGLLDHRVHRARTREGRLFEAVLLERQGHFAQAFETFEQLLVESPPGSAVRREAIRALLRAAIHALNTGRNEQAIAQLEAVVEADPCNIKANYALQLACLRTGRRADLERLVSELTAVYRWFQMPTKTIVLANSHENLLLATSPEYAALTAVDPTDAETVVRALHKARRP